MKLVSRLQVARYVRECMRSEESPRVSELARLHGVTSEHLSRSFRAACGDSLSDFMKRLQVREAQRLLRATRLSTTRIAYVCGFGTRRTFFRAYRRLTGESPDTLRRERDQQ